MSILSRILNDKKKEVAASKRVTSEKLLRRTVAALPHKKSSFEKALRGKKGVAVIAEIKRRSPSRGLLVRNFDPARIARQYKKGGAAALSVLTDKKYFGGAPEFIRRAKQASKLPVLRKDFIIDEYQVYESRLLGADAILLIAAALSEGKMRSLYKTATKLGLDTLFEVHDAAELSKTLKLRPRLLGVNNRDLRTFKVDLAVSEKLSKRVPKSALFVSESGIRDAADMKRLRAFGAKAALVGESLVTQKDPGAALKTLLGGSRAAR
jgi:indole-3-glycerol phosphate synthase